MRNPLSCRKGGNIWKGEGLSVLPRTPVLPVQGAFSSLVRLPADSVVEKMNETIDKRILECYPGDSFCYTFIILYLRQFEIKSLIRRDYATIGEKLEPGFTGLEDLQDGNVYLRRNPENPLIPSILIPMGEM
ncbi:hypothetical protein NC796_14635 [Aliifodinibius sp. S!AR15-10]|uniref:hypothetical protein n=1 Tax=Aliifodinibius sp. S!AR15-10 TaxID=2950437 RepID=UPI0028653632|nr:hypothetical protein [Aliifodinibius sp. S!AR15-10]MDR8392388.1 hypothetical protein [Aliifodinibius sp. S!AR15-10]